jgi:hypothetical protein
VPVDTVEGVQVVAGTVSTFVGVQIEGIVQVALIGMAAVAEGARSLNQFMAEPVAVPLTLFFGEVGFVGVTTYRFMPTLPNQALVHQHPDRSCSSSGCPDVQEAM